MLKRIFWAATVTIPLYFVIALENSSKPDLIGQQIIQPQQVIGYFQKKLTDYRQGLKETPRPTVKLDLNEQ
ncbi:hypothetical protein [Chroococcus sp. FPU101]|uniref:hypothetical protein n=1 Tax=Chroococcus sp. FPU101 TaxID=1974212 RepID=UPI001A8F8850|nr:hypothetical protein [Chroococcus sp. FPU101]GFE68473.1 hypothetical protein CFPU101_10830 [Chroococcus sp. FPU101]